MKNLMGDASQGEETVVQSFLDGIERFGSIGVREGQSRAGIRRPQRFALPDAYAESAAARIKPVGPLSLGQTKTIRPCPDHQCAPLQNKPEAGPFWRAVTRLQGGEFILYHRVVERQIYRFRI